MGYFLVAICCGIASAMIASSKGRSAGGWFFLGLLLGPFGLIFAAIAGKEGPAEGERKCPFCAEFIKREAVVCKHCGKDLPKYAQPANDTRSWGKEKTSFTWGKIKECPACGKDVQAWDDVCSKCGWKPEPVTGPSKWKTLPPFTFGGRKMQFKACPKCGQQHELNSLSCSGCGWEQADD